MRLHTTYDEFVSQCASLGFDLGRIESTARSTLRGGWSALEARWYESLRKGTPDFGIYLSDEYVGEAYACWRLYSRKYVRVVGRPETRALLGEVRSVLDLGCGIGYSTADLRVLFPDTAVVGTQIPGCPQFALAIQMAERFGFRVASEVPDALVDLAFASEYFEHFREPLAHLLNIHALARPRAWIVANTFTTPAAGHFPSYDVDGASFDGLATSRRFNHRMRNLGYAAADVSAWNGRPKIWIMEES